MFKKILQPFYAVYVVTALFICFMTLYPIMRLSKLGDPLAGRKRLATLLRVCFGFWLYIIGMRVRYIGARPIGSFVYVANHSSYLDTFSIAPAVHGHFRVLGKAEMAKIPFYGFVYKQMVITVDRRDLRNRALSMKKMRRHLEKDGSMVIFPEGTFNETSKPLKEFYEGAFRLAIIAQKTIQPILFPDSADRWHPSAWWKFWPGKNRVIYLDAIPVAGLTIEDTTLLKIKTYEIMEQALKKYKNTSQPPAMDQCSRFNS